MTWHDADQSAHEIAVSRYGSGVQVEAISGPGGGVFRLRLPDGTRILKLGRDGGALRKQHLLMDRLRRERIPVPAVEAAALDADPPYIIMESAGDYRAADYMNAPPLVAHNVLGEMGVLLARIHDVRIDAPEQWLPVGTIGYRDRQAYLEKLGRLAEAIAVQGLIGRNEAAAFRALPMPELTGASLCHGDFHAVQCSVREGHVTAVLDWESAWVGNPAIDFAVTQTYLESYCPGDLLASFVAAYLGRRSLPHGYERDYLPVRMAQALALMRVVHARGEAGYTARAVELFRAYMKAYDQR
jgi:aminoglycoside phosphotransferase (APT) family kinase protein